MTDQYLGFVIGRSITPLPLVCNTLGGGKIKGPSASLATLQGTERPIPSCGTAAASRLTALFPPVVCFLTGIIIHDCALRILTRLNLGSGC
jgi:hypothetical protein